MFGYCKAKLFFQLEGLHVKLLVYSKCWAVVNKTGLIWPLPRHSLQADSTVFYIFQGVNLIFHNFVFRRREFLSTWWAELALEPSWVHSGVLNGTWRRWRRRHENGAGRWRSGGDKYGISRTLLHQCSLDMDSTRRFARLLEIFRLKTFGCLTLQSQLTSHLVKWGFTRTVRKTLGILLFFVSPLHKEFSAFFHCMGFVIWGKE
jgi:hypothetical protein